MYSLFRESHQVIKFDKNKEVSSKLYKVALGISDVLAVKTGMSADLSSLELILNKLVHRSESLVFKNELEAFLNQLEYLKIELLEFEPFEVRWAQVNSNEQLCLGVRTVTHKCWQVLNYTDRAFSLEIEVQLPNNKFLTEFTFEQAQQWIQTSRADCFSQFLFLNTPFEPDQDLPGLKKAFDQFIKSNELKKLESATQLRWRLKDLVKSEEFIFSENQS